jgi:hypothetical protein
MIMNKVYQIEFDAGKFVYWSKLTPSDSGRAVEYEGGIGATFPDSKFLIEAVG